MSPDKDLETAKLLFEAVKVMVPLLTAFLTFYAARIGKIWQEMDASFQRTDVIWISIICLLSLFAFGFWALTLAGAIISTSGGDGLTIPISNENALPMARISVGIGYWFFIFVLGGSGYYFWSLYNRLKQAKKVKKRRRKSG